jgi:hypothetical protein
MIVCFAPFPNMQAVLFLCFHELIPTIVAIHIILSSPCGEQKKQKPQRDVLASKVGNLRGAVGVDGACRGLQNH